MPPKSKQLNIRMGESLMEALKRRAKELDMSQTAYVEHLIAADAASKREKALAHASEFGKRFHHVFVEMGDAAAEQDAA